VANQDAALEVISIKCGCGSELFRISTNVRGISAVVQCPICGKANVFNHSLEPESDTHQPSEAFPPKCTEYEDNAGRNRL
jgi:hypothetical protein